MRKVICFCLLIISLFLLYGCTTKISGTKGYESINQLVLSQTTLKVILTERLGNKYFILLRDDRSNIQGFADIEKKNGLFNPGLFEYVGVDRKDKAISVAGNKQKTNENYSLVYGLICDKNVSKIIVTYRDGLKTEYKVKGDGYIMIRDNYSDGFLSIEALDKNSILIYKL